MCEGGEGLTDHILPPQQLFSGAKVHRKAAGSEASRLGPGTHQAVRAEQRAGLPRLSRARAPTQASEMRASLMEGIYSILFRQFEMSRYSKQRLFIN